MVPLIIAGVMAGLQVASGFQKGEMIREQNKMRRRIDDINVEALELQAFDEEAFGGTQVARYDQVVNSTLADQRAAMAAADVDLNYGTAADIQKETKVTGFINKLEIERQSREKVQGIKRQIRNVRLGSELSSIQASMDASDAQRQGIMQGLGTFASGYAKGAK